MVTLKKLTFGVFVVLMAVGSGAAAQAQTAAQVLHTDVIRVGAIEAPPWYHQDLLTNKWTGIVPDSVEAIFKGQGVKVEFVPTTWGTAVAGLQANQFDMVGAFTKTPDRAKVVDFTMPLGTIPTGFVTTNPKYFGVKNWSELDNPSVKISAVDSSATIKGVQDLLDKSSMTLVKTSDAMLMELTSGRVDLAISNRPTLKDYIAKTQSATLVVPEPIRGTDAPFAIRKTDDHALQNWLDTRIKAGVSDGSLPKIWNQYLN